MVANHGDSTGVHDSLNTGSRFRAVPESEDVMGLFVGIDHRVHGGHGGEEKRKKKKINVSE